jgi:Uncharacterized conserved protein
MKNNKRTMVLISMLLLYAGGFSQDVKSVITPNFIFETLALDKDIPTAEYPPYSSPTDMVPSRDKTKLFIAKQTAKRVAILNVAEKSIEKEIQVPNEPTGIATSPDGFKIYVTCYSDIWPNGLVAEIDIAAGKVTSVIRVGHGARSPSISPSGDTLYVSNVFDDAISVVDLRQKKKYQG